MNLNLISNITDIPAVSNFVESQENDEWLNKNSPLFEAQKVHNEIMSKHRERIPMVIEYYQDKDTKISVQMYINPSRLSMANQKIKSKAITRGGIFYHHWGSDHWQMQLSGTVGDAGMEGIKKIEQIYDLSGVLLKYGDSTSGPVYVDENDSILDNISNGNFSGAIGSILKMGTNNFIDQFKTEAKAGIASAITGKGSSKLRSSAVTTKVSNMIAGGISKIAGTQGVNATLAKATNYGSTSNSVLGQIGGAILGNLVGDRMGITDYDSARQVVDFDVASKGWADINDELTDIWRPRQIWIFFEDRVFIGHFDNFNYQRVAETPLINYDLKFTIIRQVIVTSYNPLKPEFIPAQTMTFSSGVTNAAAQAKALIASSTSTTSNKLDLYKTRTPAAVNSAKLEILKTKETYRLEELVSQNNGTEMTSARKSQLNDWAASIRSAAGISANDELYGTQSLTNPQRLAYYRLGNSEITSPNTDAATAGESELSRINSYVSKLRANKTLTDEIRSDIWMWIQQIHSALGLHSYQSWEQSLSI